MPDYRSVVTPQKKKKKKKKQNLFAAIFQGLIPWKGDSVGEIIRKIVFIIAVVALVAALVMIIDTQFFAPKNEEIKHEQQILEILNKPITPEEIEALPEKTVNTEYAVYYGINKDFVGWVSIPGTNINYPVVQSTDNEYYLHRDIYGEYSDSGTIFADYENVFSSTQAMSGNTILYGHNMRTENFFTEVVDYRPTSYKNYRNEDGLNALKERPVINFNTLYDKATYKIFSVMLLNTTEDYGDVFRYQDSINFSTKKEFNDFCAECLDRSEYFTGVDLEYGDELLTLSTCEFQTKLYDMRVVVVARKTREGEPTGFTEEEIENFCFNPDPKLCRTVRWEEGYDEQWSGRYWDPAWIDGYERDDSFVSSEE